MRAQNQSRCFQPYVCHHSCHSFHLSEVIPKYMTEAEPRQKNLDIEVGAENLFSQALKTNFAGQQMEGNKVSAMPVASYAYSSNDSHSAFGPPSYDSYNTFASPYGHVPVVTPPAPVHHTMVVVNQVAPQTLAPGRRTWSSGLYSCCEDVGVCLCATFLPYCAAAKLAQDMGEHCCVPFCVPGWLVVLRTKLRTQMNIEGSVCNDGLVTCCCGTCAMCQLMREVSMARQSGQLP